METLRCYAIRYLFPPSTTNDLSVLVGIDKMEVMEQGLVNLVICEQSSTRD